MDESETRLMLSFGRAYRMLEGWIRADVTVSAERLLESVFGDSPELGLVKVLAQAESPLHLSQISARCGASRRDVSSSGRVRRALSRMEELGAVINVGTRSRPKYQLNVLKAEGKLLISIFARECKPPS